MRFVNTKTIASFVTVVFLLFIIKNIVVSIVNLNQNSQIVTNLMSQEENAKKQNQFLKERLYFVNTDEFIEKQAREKRGRVKQGEHIVLAPPATSSPNEIKNPDTTPNWKKWWKLFF